MNNLPRVNTPGKFLLCQFPPLLIAIRTVTLIIAPPPDNSLYRKNWNLQGCLLSRNELPGVGLSRIGHQGECLLVIYVATTLLQISMLIAGVTSYKSSVKF